MKDSRRHLLKSMLGLGLSARTWGRIGVASGQASSEQRRSSAATALHGITWQHPRGFAPLAATAVRYSQLRPSVEVQWEQRDWNAFESRVTQVLLTGSAEYDLVMMDHPWVSMFAQAASLVPFDDVFSREELRRLKEEVVAPSLESYIYGGKLWALPVDAACHVFMYRADLLAKADAAVPQDWDAVLALSERLHHPPDQYALCLPLDFDLFLSLAATFGSVPYADPTRAVLPPDQGLRVLKLMKQLQRYCYSDPGAAYEVMTASDLVCMCPSSFGFVNYSYPRDGKKALSYAPVPGPSRGTRGHPILGGVGLGVPAASRHREEAVRYARFVMSPEAQVGIFPSNDGQPGLLAAWKDPSVQSKTGSFYPAMLECMSSAYTRPNFPGWMPIEHESAEPLRRYLQGSLEPEQVLSELEQIRSWHVQRVPGATRR